MERDKSRFQAIVESSRDDRTNVRKLVEDKRWREAEPDRTRMTTGSAAYLKN
jgi:endonuclease G, mitochondrial